MKEALSAYKEMKKTEFAALRRAALCDELDALYHLASDFYFIGLEGVAPRNPELCFFYTDRAAQRGHLRARVFRAVLYRLGHGVQQDGNKALSEFEAAAAEGSVLALAELADIYMKGRIAPQDRSKGMAMHKEAYERLLQQDEAFVRAESYTVHIVQYPLGLLFGIGVEQDRKLATDLLQRAAKAGYQQAIRILTERRVNFYYLPRSVSKKERDFVGVYYPLAGVLHETSCAPLLPPVKVEAYGELTYQHAQELKRYEIFKRAALGGDVDAAYQLGTYYYARGVAHVAPKNPDYAFRYVDQAASAGYLPARAERGSMYLRGVGTAQDIDRGVRELTRAYQDGSLKAARLLAQYYTRNNNVDVDASRTQGCTIYKELFDALMKTARAGSKPCYIEEAPSVIYYPLCLIYGVGVPADPQAGKSLLAEAAELGFFNAQDILDENQVLTLYIPFPLSLEDIDRNGGYLSLDAALPGR